MLNILYTGHYRENSSFGFSSRQYISALKIADNINLSIRPIFMHDRDIFEGISKEYHDLENTKLSSYDLIIQDTLPNFYEYNANFGKNICIPKIETRNLSHTGWIERINMMDEVWVGSFFADKSLRESGVDKKIKVIPTPFDVDKIKSNIKKKEDKEYNFYTISSLSPKDNLLNLLIAYFMEFDKNENTRLIIKLKEDSENQIKNLITRAYNYSRKNINSIQEPIIINGYISEDKMIDLHNNSDCYIDISKASYAGLSCIQSLLYNNMCICNNNTGPSSWVTTNNGFNVKSKECNVLCDIQYNIPSLYTHNEIWYESDINSIRSNMRSAYQLSETEKTNKLNYFDSSMFDQNKFKKHIA